MACHLDHIRDFLPAGDYEMPDDVQNAVSDACAQVEDRYARKFFKACNCLYMPFGEVYDMDIVRTPVPSGVS